MDYSSKTRDKSRKIIDENYTWGFVSYSETIKDFDICGNLGKGEESFLLDLVREVTREMGHSIGSTYMSDFSDQKLVERRILLNYN